MKVWRRGESWKGIYQEGGRGGDQKVDEFRISQTIFEMSASYAGNLAYDRVVFRRVVKAAKF
jgi:hypothetical protein